LRNWSLPTGFRIATGSRRFPGLVGPAWTGIILAPNGHPLTTVKHLTLPVLAGYPLVTYVFGTTGESSLKKAFAEQGLEPNVVFTARDADIIKTYVRMGMGVGIVAPMAYECQDQKDLTAISAEGLFPDHLAGFQARRIGGGALFSATGASPPSESAQSPRWRKFRRA
jgi:LysR family cys regulon transcriptional activator